ncbi:MAG: ABC transporter permease [Anaerolineae bacterium]
MARVPFKYVLKRTVYLIVVVWFAATINFILPRLASRDPVLEHLTELEASVGSGRRGEGSIDMIDMYKEWAGLNQPLWKQYTNYMNNMLHMDFGYSFSRYRPVLDIVSYALPWTLGLLGTTTLISFAFGTVMGALGGWRRSAKLLNVSVSFLMLLAVIPPFIIGLVLADVLAFRLKLFPIAGIFTPGRRTELLDMAWWLDVLHHAALPSLSILLGTAGTWAMGMRGMMITILGSDFITFAEAKGVKRWRLLLSYAIRNVLLPQTTLLAMSLGTLVASTTIVEVMFGYPGVGSVLEEALRAFDYNLIQGCVFFLILAIALTTYALDLMYPVLDPRISYRKHV